MRLDDLRIVGFGMYYLKVLRREPAVLKRVDVMIYEEVLKV